MKVTAAPVFRDRLKPNDSTTGEGGEITKPTVEINEIKRMQQRFEQSLASVETIVEHPVNQWVGTPDNFGYEAFDRLTQEQYKMFIKKRPIKTTPISTSESSCET